MSVDPTAADLTTSTATTTTSHISPHATVCAYDPSPIDPLPVGSIIHELPTVDEYADLANSPPPEDHAHHHIAPSIAPHVSSFSSTSTAAPVLNTRTVVPGIGIKVDAKEAKRLRRSEIEKRSRARRQGSVSGMREELQRLERQYALLTSQNNDATASFSGSSDRHGVIIHPRELPSLRKRLLDLSREASALHDDRKALRVMLHEKQLFSDSVRALLTEFSDKDAFSYNAVVHAKYEPLELSQCCALMRDAYETIARFDNTRNFISSGSSVLGWTDKRRLDESDGKMHFSFTKQFASGDPEQLLEQSWEMFRDQQAMRRTIFSAGVHVNLETLQVVSDDILVMRRHTKYLAMDRAFHTVYLLFRVQTERGFTLCFRTIPCPAIQNSMEEGESWIELFHWSTFQYLDNGRVEVSFGGSLGGAVLKFAMHWMIELIMTVVRWENACVAPLFIK